MQFVDLPWWGWAMQVIASLGALVLMYKLTFEDKDDFIESIKFWLIPDWISILRGEGIEDFWAEAKLLWFLLGTLVISAVVYFVLTKIAT